MLGNYKLWGIIYSPDLAEGIELECKVASVLPAG